MLNARIVTNRKPIATSPASILILAGALSACMAGSAAAQFHTIFAGDEDDFGNSNDPDDALVIRPLLADYLSRPGGRNDLLHGGEPMPFDANDPNNRDYDWDFGYTFENIPMLQPDAKLRIRVQSVTGSRTEYLAIQYTGDGNSLDTLWIENMPVLNGGSWTQGESVIFDLDLGNLPGGVNIIDEINAAGYLDVIVGDDTSVDWIELTIPAPGTASLLALGGVAAMRRRRR